MTNTVEVNGVPYISSKRASKQSGYTQDYVGQLAREGEIDARRIGGLWYINPESLFAHKEDAERREHEAPVRHEQQDTSSYVTFDGKRFISSKRATEVTGYSQDYIGQLARSGKILARQVGRRWFIEQSGLLAHKKHNDELLAAVQAQAMGVGASRKTVPQAENRYESPYKYISDERELLPNLKPKNISGTTSSPSRRRAEDDNDDVHKINVRILHTNKAKSAPVRERADAHVVISHNPALLRTKNDRRTVHVLLIVVLALIFAVLAAVTALLILELRGITTTFPGSDAVGGWIDYVRAYLTENVLGDTEIYQR